MCFPLFSSAKVEISPEIRIGGSYGCLYMVSMRLEGVSILLRGLIHSSTRPILYNSGLQVQVLLCVPGLVEALGHSSQRQAPLQVLLLVLERYLSYRVGAYNSLLFVFDVGYDSPRILLI